LPAPCVLRGRDITNAKAFGSRFHRESAFAAASKRPPKPMEKQEFRKVLLRMLGHCPDVGNLPFPGLADFGGFQGNDGEGFAIQSDKLDLAAVVRMNVNNGPHIAFLQTMRGEIFLENDKIKHFHSSSPRIRGNKVWNSVLNVNKPN